MNRMQGWGGRLRKAADYLGRGDVAGLAAEIRQFLAWFWLAPRLRASRPEASAETHQEINPEARFWDECDHDLVRRVSWTHAADFGTWAFLERAAGRWSDVVELIRDLMDIPLGEPLRGLVLGCGDMVAEHGMFTRAELPFAEVDAYDLSTDSIRAARELTDGKGLKVNYHVADINRIELPAERYALAITLHSFHHFREVDRVARQINRALLPGGVFYTVDYIGPRRLQYSRRQLHYAQLVLEALPAEYRRQLDGSVRKRVKSVPLWQISPDEAVRSDRILPALKRHLNVRWQCNWAGLLYPLLEGIGFNFDPSRPVDTATARLLFGLDRVLCERGYVEPNFTITAATKR